MTDKHSSAEPTKGAENEAVETVSKWRSGFAMVINAMAEKAHNSPATTPEPSED